MSRELDARIYKCYIYLFDGFYSLLFFNRGPPPVSAPRKLLESPAHDVPEFLHLPAYGLGYLRKLPRHGFRFLLNLLLKLPSPLATLDLEQVLRLLELANICQDHAAVISNGTKLLVVLDKTIQDLPYLLPCSVVGDLC
ncbi:unnamed protein product [Linum trigynum]|uniref:Uncharacterized protein n=1 Tax=Linum trigynum TaxID=586398 RepID=A0AAV2GMH3_9ROSI